MVYDIQNNFVPISSLEIPMSVVSFQGDLTFQSNEVSYSIFKNIKSKKINGLIT